MADEVTQPDHRCVICYQPIPEVRLLRGACTCSKEHGQQRKQELRAWKSARKGRCQFCGRGGRANRKRRIMVAEQCTSTESLAPGAGFSNEEICV